MRTPIDPNLPPDHPLEPRSAAGGRSQSAAERIAASEAVVASKPPIIADPAGKPDFIAAARRAAHAATAAPEQQAAPTAGIMLPNTRSDWVRKVMVAAAVVLLAIGCYQIASRFFDGNSAPHQIRSEIPAAPGGSPLQTVPPADAPPPNTAPNGGVPPSDAAPATVPSAPPKRQSLNSAVPGAAEVTMPLAETASANAMVMWPSPDVTGSLSASSSKAAAAPAAATVVAQSNPDDKLPPSLSPTLRAAALAGNPAAAYEVAVRLADGRGVPQNNEEAVRWLTRAAKNGLAPAEFRLAGLYEKGIGVKKDLANARDLYRAAAEKGHGKAMHNLAVLYAEGADGSADYRAAAQWFRKAADHGIRDSQYNLGILYARGIGVEQSYAESYKWFFLAALQGDKDGAKKRDEMASHLGQQALSAARLAAQAWKAQPQPPAAITVKTPAAWAGRSSKPKSRQAAKAAAGEIATID
jgi:localization factor PodJL